MDSLGGLGGERTPFPAGGILPLKIAARADGAGGGKVLFCQTAEPERTTDFEKQNDFAIFLLGGAADPAPGRAVLAMARRGKSGLFAASMTTAKRVGPRALLPLVVTVAPVAQAGKLETRGERILLGCARLRFG